ncbi:MAG: C25 family cysteine peptidase, partial [Candidatus Freyarchaeota archaeon]
MKTSLAKLGFLAVLITIVVSFTFLPASNSWVPTIIAQNQQTIQIQGVPTPIILKTNTTQYVIIVPPDWASNTNLTQFAEWKTTRGIPTTIINTTYIYNNYPGEDNATKIRSFLKHAYDAWNIHWVLLVGNTNIIPMRYFWTGSGYPVRDIGNLAGAWMRTAVFAGGQISQTQDIQGWRIKNYIRDTVIPTELNITFTSLFYDSNSRYNNLTLDSFNNAINSGCAIVNLCSHGSNITVTRSESGGPYYTADAASRASNGYKLPLVFASACSTAHLDGTGDCLGEAMLKNSNGGAVSYIGATRTSFGGDDISDLSDSLLDALFFEALLQTGNALFS